MDDREIDKVRLLAAAVAQVEAKLRELAASYAAAREMILSMPHVMKGKREVSGMEASYLANSLARSIQERELELRTLRSLRLPEGPARVALGCLVGVGPEDGPPETIFFLLPVCGGMELPADEGAPSVRVITPATPVARALLGRSLGDEATLPTAPPRTATIRLLA